MMDFIYKLYSYDNFTLYLTIALIVLVILFVLVFIFGKKDQKLEETKRLQKIELEKTQKLELEKQAEVAFKEETLATAVEVKPEEVSPVVEAPTMENTEVEQSPVEDVAPIFNDGEAMLTPNVSVDAEMNKEDVSPVVEGIFPSIDEMAQTMEGEKLEETPEVKEETPITTTTIPTPNDVNMIVFEPTKKEDEEVESLEEIVVPKSPNLHKDIEEEELPISVDNLASFKFDELDEQIEQELTTLESIKNQFNSIELPEVETNNSVEEVKVEDLPQVTEEKVEEPIKEEIPEIKETPKYERAEWPPKDEKKPFTPSQVFSSVFVPKVDDVDQNIVDEMPKVAASVVEDDEDEFELPELKAVDEIPLANSAKDEVVKEEMPKKENMFSFDDFIH